MHLATTSGQSFMSICAGGGVSPLKVKERQEEEDEEEGGRLKD